MNGRVAATTSVPPHRLAGAGDSVLDCLTDEQRVAAGASATKVFIEAGPGTGKTTVSAHRFAVHRFQPPARADGRAVVAVSFTRSATWNLQRRVLRVWGPSALVWPHRIVTLDTIMCDLLHDLLRERLIRWPNGHTTLDVHDSWTAFSSTFWARAAHHLRVTDVGRIQFATSFTRDQRARVPPTVIQERVNAGVCTHQDVRSVLEQALADRRCKERVATRIGQTMRALIVDEVFDANDLDIAVIELAIRAGLAVTLVGDPWQALYVFRGARPEVVAELVRRTDVRTLPLTHSFRWQDDSQRKLADSLRAGRPVTLPAAAKGDAELDVDVVLGLHWKPLWQAGDHVLPLAFHAFKGGSEEAAATLLLNHVTRNILSEDATYLREALTALAIRDPEVPRRLEPQMQEVVELLRIPGKAALNNAYRKMSDVVSTVSPRILRPAHAAHTGRLAAIARRILYSGRPVPGLTTHQAKGREWDVVGLCLAASEQEALAGGLNVGAETHRQLYVACTRACRATVAV
jgi:DNA helicase II / ATP-dependent DNA helicase PcrA